MTDAVNIFDYISVKDFKYFTFRNTGVIHTIKKVLKKAAINNEGVYTCYVCGNDTVNEKITVDHIIPLSRGGINHRVNMKLCCSCCNRQKSNELPSLEEVENVMHLTLDTITECRKQIRMILSKNPNANVDGYKTELKKLLFFARYIELTFF